MLSFKFTHCCGITEVQYIHDWIAPKVKKKMPPKTAMIEFIKEINSSSHWAVERAKAVAKASDEAYAAQCEAVRLIDAGTPISLELFYSTSSTLTPSYAAKTPTTAYSFIFMTDTPSGKEDLQFFKDMVASCKYGEVTEGVKFINRNSGRTCQVVTWVLPESVFTARPSMIGYSDLIVPEDESK